MEPAQIITVESVRIVIPSGVSFRSGLHLLKVN